MIRMCCHIFVHMAIFQCYIHRCRYMIFCLHLTKIHHDKHNVDHLVIECIFVRKVNFYKMLHSSLLRLNRLSNHLDGHRIRGPNRHILRFYT